MSEKRTSASAGRAASTRHDRSRARSRAASHSVVLPMPASPSMTTTHGPARRCSNSRATVASSCSLPTTSVATTPRTSKDADPRIVPLLLPLLQHTASRNFSDAL